jgi:SAM-dependent methyltransferase
MAHAGEDGLFDAYGKYYDLLYRDKNYAAEADYVHALLSRHAPGTREILELGSGTGIHARLLAQHGYRVVGIERSAEMAARARHTPGDGFDCQVGDIRTLRLGRAFDAVLALFHVVSYQVTNSDVLATFATASAHLNAGGVFVFDVWYGPAVHAQKPAVRVKRAHEGNLQLTRVAEPLSYPNDNRIDVRFTIFAHDQGTGEFVTFSEVHPMRHFSLPEIDLLAEISGFERVAAEEFLTGSPPGEDTWGVCVVLRKRKA